jgi:hypothetical protein
VVHIPVRQTAKVLRTKMRILSTTPNNIEAVQNAEYISSNFAAVVRRTISKMIPATPRRKLGTVIQSSGNSRVSTKVLPRGNSGVRRMRTEMTAKKRR